MRQDLYEAWKIGRKAGLKAQELRECPYPSGTTASAEFWLGYHGGRAEQIAEMQVCPDTKQSMEEWAHF